MRDSLQLLEKFSKACSAVEQKWPCPYALKFIPSSDSAHWGHMDGTEFIWSEEFPYFCSVGGIRFDRCAFPKDTNFPIYFMFEDVNDHR